MCVLLVIKTRIQFFANKIIEHFQKVLLDVAIEMIYLVKVFLHVTVSFL